MDIQISIKSDTATPEVSGLRETITGPDIKRAVGTAAVRLTQGHLRSLGPNKMGWPTTRFYEGAARGTYWEPTPTGVSVFTDNERSPGAMRQRFHGGPILARDKKLTIPAAPQFYGRRATDFSGLRFAILGGHPALVTTPGDTGLVDFATGRSRSVKGTGLRAQPIVAYWLRDEVIQEPDPGVLPTPDEYAEAAIDAVATLVTARRGG